MALNYSELETKCKKTIEHFKKDLGRVRTGRATTTILDGLQVEYYGTMVPLIQLGMVSAPEPRQLCIQVYDAAAGENIEKAIQKSQLGVNPVRDANTIRINFPPLTEERRKEQVKLLHKMTEDARVVIRTHRRDFNEFLKTQNKSKAVSDDELRKGMEEVQKITDKQIKDLDALSSQKEKEMMEV